MDWNLLLSIVGAVTSITAIVGLVIELRNSRIAIQTDTLLQLESRMYSPDMILARQTAAKKLLDGSNIANQELETVLDFLATVCILYEHGAIDKVQTYYLYSYWLTRYWLSAKEYIMQIRANDDPQSWTHVEALAKRFLDDDVKKYKNPSVSKEQIKAFLFSEANTNPPQQAPEQTDASKK